MSLLHFMRDRRLANSVAQAEKEKLQGLKHEQHSSFHPYCPTCLNELKQVNTLMLEGK